MDARILELGEKCRTFAVSIMRDTGGRRPPDVAGRSESNTMKNTLNYERILP